MPHIHALIDFVVVVYIVHEHHVLLVDHRALKLWLPVGGHIELHEDPEEALMREIDEECGLDVTILGQRPALHDEGTKALITPEYMDIHEISNGHRHIGLVYFARSASDAVRVNTREHRALRWFSARELEDPHFALKPFIRFYAREALGTV